MSDDVVIEGKLYISSKRASEMTGYSQDYIGQLARGGYIDARRVGGLWHVSLPSVQEHEKKSREAKSQQTSVQNADRSTLSDIDSLVTFDGMDYVSASRAAELCGYNADYVGQLARSGTVPARQVGNRWYVGREAILKHKAEKDRLLGAVQSESVGIHHSPPQSSTNVADSRRDDAASYTYSQDSRDLHPNIGRRTDALEDESEEDDGYAHSVIIPIRTPPPDSVGRRVIGVNREVRVARKSIYYGFIFAFAVLGFFALLFFVFVKLAPTDSFRLQSSDAGLFMRMVDFVGDVLESFLVGEITYKR